MNEVPSPRALLAATPRRDETALVRTLFSALEESGIFYCHWKSNCRLGETMAALEDIDILVDRRDAAALLSEMGKKGFKLAVSSSGTGHPSTFHAIGLDPESAQLVDLHACHQVYSGDSLVKNYRMALEGPLLSHTRKVKGVRVPEAELELVYFVLRIALKHLSPIEMLKSNRRYEKTSGELQWLLREADEAKAAELCTSLFPSIDQRTFDKLLDAIGNDRALIGRALLGWKVAWRLRGLKRLGTIRAFVSRTWRVLALVASRLTRRKGLSLQTGGFIVALVGPKATGKSTLANELAVRFGKHLKVLRIHAGKPPASVLSWLPMRFVPLARRLLPHERLSAYENTEKRQSRKFSLFYVARMTLLAYDRRKLLRHALRQAAAGAIVISDRYPSQTNGAIDSSCFDDVAIEKCRSPLKRWLMKKEQSIYQDLPRPDLVIRLEAPMDLALQRDATRQKLGGPDAEAVRRRWELESSAKFPGSLHTNLSTTAPLEETVRRAAAIIWSSL